MTTRAKLLLLTVVIIIALVLFLEAQKPEMARLVNKIPLSLTSSGNESARKDYLPAVELTGISGYINTDAISLQPLIGKKVILVDFWTYSCINCQRTIPYLKAWYGKYQDQGLEIIGVHTPEFDFEKKRENVAAAVQKFGILYPVVQDNDYATWTAYNNHYWPHKYLIDINGFIAYDHIGEGGYDQTEQKIQELLDERMKKLAIAGTIIKDLAKPQGVVAIDTAQVSTPEIYFGSARNTSLGNGKSQMSGEQVFTEPKDLRVNNVYLSGDWDIKSEYAQNVGKTSKIILRYQAKNVYFVASAANAVTVTLLRDGKPLQATAGEDVVVSKDTSKVNIKEDRLYTLIEDQEYGEHTLEILIEQPGLKAFTFTFG